MPELARLPSRDKLVPGDFEYTFRAIIENALCFFFSDPLDAHVGGVIGSNCHAESSLNKQLFEGPECMNLEVTSIVII